MQQINDLEIDIIVILLLQPLHEKILTILTYDEDKETLLLQMDREQVVIDNDLVPQDITYQVL
jgi:hypothetical protein